jgi:hypothetical protein
MRRRVLNDEDGGSSSSGLSKKQFQILADDPDDAKIRAKKLLESEGYDERSLQQATWTVSRLDRPRGKKARKR